MKKTKKQNKNIFTNIIFILMLIFIFIFFGIGIIQNKNMYNLVENRLSYKLHRPHISTFKTNEFQDNLELATKDQIPLHKYFQLFYPKFTNYIDYKSSKILKLDKNKYTNLSSINLYNDYLVYSMMNEKDIDKNFKDDLDYINYLSNNTDKKIYLYYINSDNEINFETKEKINIDNYIKNNINENIKYDSLKINNFKEYKEYFYKTDHHMNYKGSNYLYNELSTFMNLNKVDINNEMCFKSKEVLGSKSKSIALTMNEKMCMYNYNYPNFEIKINDEVTNYGTPINEIKKEKVLSYAILYGSDYPEIIINNLDNQNNKKLLIYSNSYSNAVNKLLASSYQTTYVIDGRYNETFDMLNYINEKEIDDILILSNKVLFFDTKKWGEINGI